MIFTKSAINNPFDNLKWLWLNHWTVTRHKILVSWYIARVCLALIRRAILHDLSAYSHAESVCFRDWTEATQGLTYGTEEYRRAIKQFARDDQIHYSANRHHPEYWPAGINDMSPIDLIEMLCDWKAKGKTRQGIGNIKSISINSEKFNYDEQFKNGLIRDAREAFN